MSNTQTGRICHQTRNAILAGFCVLPVLFSAMAYAGPTASEYGVEVIEGPFPANVFDPNLPYTELRDISHNGLAVFYSESVPSDATDYSTIIYAAGLYDIVSGEYTILNSGEYPWPGGAPTGFTPYGINAPGALVGGDGCQVVDKRGNLTQPVPVPQDYVVCETRGIASNGLISGFTVDEQGTWRGFVYDLKSGSFEEFLPDPDRTLAQGINSKGETVGGIGPGGNRDGFIRYSDNSTRLFQVKINGSSYDTRARGISEDGAIAGVYVPLGEDFRGFVGRLSDDPEDHDLIPDAIFTPDTVPECVATFITRINNAGVVSGICYTGGGYAKGLLLTPFPSDDS